ncbi:CYP27A1 [Branchiostoma lanceolatum]|uniref:CYP27A1 protein n=1 Tax=Branchiostoma lanceolatum TaxID=7740 RepID=A0A8J9VG92_BRALA|nr:CYP27A1 [Branchiostoma lanceolatum]
MSLLQRVVGQRGSLFRVCGARSLAALKTTYRPQSTRAEESAAHGAAARPFDEIPGPKGLPLIGTAWDYTPFGRFPLKTNMRDSFRERRKTYGSIYREKLGPMDLVVISDPKEIEKVFRNEGRYPERLPLMSMKIYRELKKMPVGLVNQCRNGEEWQRVRSSVQKDMMRPKTVGAYASLQDDVSRDLVDVIRALTEKEESGGQVHNFTNYVYRWALESISVVVLDKRLGCMTLEDLEPGSDAQLMIDGVNDFFNAFVKLELSAVGLYKYISTPTWRKFEKGIDQWHTVAAKLLNEKLAKSAAEDGKPSESDFLQSLLSRNDVTFEEAMLTAVELLFGGIDTTGNTLMFNLFCLAKNPEAQKKLYQEIMEVISAGQPVDDKMLNKMHYLRAVVKETFRVYPTAPNNLRILDRDIVLSGYVVPAKLEGQVSNGSCLQLADESSAMRAGVIKADLECKSHPAARCKHPNQNQHVSLELVPLEKADAKSVWVSDSQPTKILMATDVISSHPEYYPEPEVFKPERWLRTRDDESSGVQPFTHLPFGYGPRMCIGRRFAEQELFLGLIRIVQNFHVGWSGEDMKQVNRMIQSPDRDSFVFSERA